MFTLKIDDTGDIELKSGQLQMVSGQDEIAQSCRIILGINKGEWFLNPELGIDHSKFLGKGVSEDEMRDEIMSGLLQEPRVQTVESIDIEIDRANRSLVISFVATSKEGQVITAEGVEIGG
ncbi:DUF2634 domain-containing protein [Paenibacillus sp. FSL R5-0636]|uniref:DUF2634 domain-containing protein n=1 Tax=Paenibacillus TaxID=44249 RepID=UPI00096DB3EE|nr:DUF2634 domain-containing protein [Paenibacillus odorifer]OMD05759.1 hypothetical protein BJP49_19490 [Paenibacillus odorifer]